VATLHLVFTPTNKFNLLKFDSQDITNLPESEIMETLIYLKRHTQSKDLEGIETYLYKLKE
jgi:hypothetical protein